MSPEFDYIIVGAGSAGCVVANKLSANPANRILLLEAGPWDRDPRISIPVGLSSLAKKSLYRWDDIAEPDPALAGRRMEVPHGKVVGGTSSINFMAAVRGHPGDYQAWVDAGAAGWGYEDVLPFFREIETWQGGHCRWRGGDGELGVQVARTPDPIMNAFLEAARQLGYPATADYNGALNEGFGPIQYTMRNGRRSSSASAFLQPVLKRANLHVIAEAHAKRLLFEEGRVVGVIYDRFGHEHVARSGFRTILCLGAINTPQLLMLSGIGPARHLRSLGIEPRADLPVGEGLEDHLGTLAYFTRKDRGVFHRSLRLDRAAANLLRALVLRSGPAAELPGAVTGFVKTRGGLTQPDIQMIIPSSSPQADAWFPGIKKPYVDGYMLRAQLIGQKSRGSVTLASADYRDRPHIRHNSLSHPDDILSMRAGMRLSWAIGASPALAPFRSEAVLPPAALVSDEEVDAFVRETAIHLYHPASTCRMGSGPEAVLDSNLAVRGIDGLFVVDASAMPRLVSGNPNAAIMMMGAKAADIWLRRP